MEENQDSVEIFFHNLPVLSPETLLPASKVSSAYSMTDLSHDGQNLSHELLIIFISIIIFC